MINKRAVAIFFALFLIIILGSIHTKAVDSDIISDPILSGSASDDEGPSLLEKLTIVEDRRSFWEKLAPNFLGGKDKDVGFLEEIIGDVKSPVSTASNFLKILLIGIIGGLIYGISKGSTIIWPGIVTIEFLIYYFILIDLILLFFILSFILLVIGIFWANDKFAKVNSFITIQILSYSLIFFFLPLISEKARYLLGKVFNFILPEIIGNFIGEVFGGGIMLGAILFSLKFFQSFSSAAIRKATSHEKIKKIRVGRKILEATGEEANKS